MEGLARRRTLTTRSCANLDIWILVRRNLALRGSRATVVSVESHVDQVDQAKGFTSQLMAIGDDVADVLARRGADLHEAPLDLATEWLRLGTSRGAYRIGSYNRLWMLLPPWVLPLPLG